ncbi:hypothetical protein BDZ45DRAFT_752863 [Acephala macrosclerotiorum]|nr:hypothetical protein BDZ45DRAFT_752863 [Acephala macrosclerotiorum]
MSLTSMKTHVRDISEKIQLTGTLRTTMLSAIHPTLIQELKSLVPNASIVLPSSPNYARHLERWSMLWIKQAVIQGGCRWKDIYPILDEHNVAIVGRACNSVGVGGLTLHGGDGFLTGRHGLALDNLLEAEMILASGDIVGFQPQENLRWMGNFVFSGEGEVGGKGKVIKIAMKVINKALMENRKGDNACCMRWRLEKDLREPSIHVMCFHNGSEEGGKEYFKDIFDEGLRGKLVSESMAMMRAGQCGMDTPHTLGVNQILKGGSHVPHIRPEFFEELWNNYLRFLRTSGYSSSYMLWGFHNMGEVLKVEQKETGFPNRGNYGNLMCAATWEPNEGLGPCTRWVRKIADKVRGELERTQIEWGDQLDENSKTTVGEYTNYDGLGEGAKFLYRGNYERLLSIKRKYDPNNVFNKFADLLAEADS